MQVTLTQTESLLLIIFLQLAAWPSNALLSQENVLPKTAGTRSEGLVAWQQVYSVMTHPRCLNCHTASNHPEQGDDRHRHFANVLRGRAGAGVAAFHCSTCHQERNADSTGVPGGLGWHMAPLSMAWQDVNDAPLPSGVVCRAVSDRSRNGNRDGAGLLKHNEEEALVRWAWQPGRGIDGSPRTVPPLTHDEFVAATRKWVEAGMPCPQP
jgi:mono/diheme cytochrome c family protein